MEHTKEKLQIYNTYDYDIILFTNTEPALEGGIALVQGNTEQSEANAARLALCWNTHDDLVEALEAAESHLDYCGYGDEWERECAEGLPEKIASALSAARGEK